MKSILRKILRFYLTHTPIKRGLYRLVYLLHPYLAEDKVERVYVKDRGYVDVNLRDEAEYLLYYGIYEYSELPTLKRILQHCTTIMDIGANVGQMSLLFSRYAKRVYAFEPLPEAAEKLRSNLRLNQAHNVFVYQIAMGNKSGRVNLQTPPESNTGLGYVSDTGSMNVPMYTVDEFAHYYNVKKLDLIKLDIEGGELSALRGARGVLEKHSPIVILEMNDYAMKACGYTAEDVVRFMREFNYACFSITREGLSPCESPNPRCENYVFLPMQVEQPYNLFTIPKRYGNPSRHKEYSRQS